MFSSAITSIISFASTNIDDIFVLMLFFSQVDNVIFKKRYIVIGQYLGIGILVSVSLLGAFGLHFVPHKYVGILGFIPIILGIKEWIVYIKLRKNTDEMQKQQDNKGKKSAILSVVLVTIANGADNIGVYIPLFTGYSSVELIISVIIFTLMIALWCFAGYRLSAFPAIKNRIQKYKYILVPIVFIGLGLYIIVESGLFALLFER